MSMGPWESTASQPIPVIEGDHVYRRRGHIYLGVVTKVKTVTVRCNGPLGPDTFATRFEIYVGEPPLEEEA